MRDLLPLTSGPYLPLAGQQVAPGAALEQHHDGGTTQVES